MSTQIEQALDGYRDVRDRTSARLFTAIYSSPWLQAVLGLRGDGHDATASRATQDETFEALVALRVAALRTRLDEGGVREAAVRVLLYAGSDEPRLDVRGFRMAEQIRDQYLAGAPLPGPERRQLVKEQFFLLLLDEPGALAALPRMLPSEDQRTLVLDAARRILSATGELSDERRARLARVEEILKAAPIAPTPVS